MKGDFSRFSFDATRNVRNLTVQQGRVLTDADLNEGSEAVLRRIETGTRDALGPVAAAVGTDGFKILPPAGGLGLRLSAGRLYVDGLQLENHAEVPIPVPAPDGRYLICVKAVIDHATGVELPVLRDAALGDADTAGRAIVRTGAVALPAGASDTCASANALFDAMQAPSGGRMTVTLTPAAASADPCKLSPDSGYARLENLLYRCEVHGGVAAGSAPDRYALAGLKLKLSRNNAMELARITLVDAKRITLAAASKDGLPVFRKGEFVEFLPAGAPYDAAPAGPLTRIDDVLDDILVVTDPTGAAAGGRVRLWSQDVVTLGAGNKLSIDGLDFTFSGADFRLGDYWVAPGRYALHDLDTTVPKGVALAPLGPRVVHAKLGLLTVAGGAVAPASIVDCRPLFVPLTQSVELAYAGGDGQSIRPPTGPGAPALTAPLPGKLRAIVRIGHQPVAGATVRFAIVQPSPAAGALAGNGPAGPATQIDVTSGADGVAEAEWTPSALPGHAVQQVSATLVTSLNPGQLAPPPLRYTAQLELAARVAYEPGACSGLDGKTTVQEALDQLCQDLQGLTKSEFIIATEVLLRASGRRLDNNEFVKPEELLEGFEVSFDDALATKVQDGFEPIARLTLDLPYPNSSSALIDWMRRFGSREQGPAFGTSPVHLSGEIAIQENKLVWSPTRTARAFLELAHEHHYGLEWNNEPPVVFDEPYIRAWITVRGDSVWAGEREKQRYLNGEMLRHATQDNPFSVFRDTDGTELGPEQLRTRVDPQRAADFTLWFKLDNRRR